MPVARRIVDYPWPIIAAWALVALIAGAAAHALGYPALSVTAWLLGALPVLAVMVADILRSLSRGQAGVDIIAALSITAAIAFDESLAAAIVALMYAGGRLLESFAEGRARREMTALLGRVPRTALRYHNGELSEVPLDGLVPGERILVRRGEVIPVDGRLAEGSADLDMSALTGESTSVRRLPGEEVPSGCVSLGAAFDLIVLRPAAESTYAGIVRLVEQAQASRAPIVHLADRYALFFLGATLLTAALAWWLSGDRQRALAVLVVATPCPLILAVPVALISGLSRAASEGVLIKSGAALEMLARVKVAVLDKTGTMTTGSAGVMEVRAVTGFEDREVLRLAASLDQASGHASARSLVAAAHLAGLTLSSPSDVMETSGSGLEGLVDGRRVVVGGSDFVRSRSLEGDPHELGRDIPPGSAVVAVAVDGLVAGIILLSDQLRADAKDLLAALRGSGIQRLVMASGDQRGIVATIGSTLGVEASHGEVLPLQKVAIVQDEKRYGPVLMVGDGVNDAPALSAADVGVAVGAGGVAASAEVADVVLLVDDLNRLADAISIARRTRRIALQSVWVGIGLSLIAMVAAAIGFLPPVQGALLQELIDVTVILNALRVLTPASSGRHS
ncbi:heavy metal translocating P-type ATPase [Ciceribacter sp. L1K23]|uniref:heavy metal translocating P-type ATPase n=1 Tax=Ciceribacter sp. L1K23 TaxID=2820276 RepID=UPI001B83D4BE|nr:heavy metal translocating P-type ATPase [Ciceribacter sp. L1K23]MBR0554214.1 heavy metal translocating P-type ATPase [Ciceribacter sp. L1K23]